MLILHYNYFNVWVYRTRVAHCTFEITLLQAIMLTLLLVCSFSPKVQSIFWGPRILAHCHWTKQCCDKSLFCDVLSDIFLFRENCIKKCHSFPSHLSLYFIKYAPSILFLKILKYYNSTILYNSPKKSHFCATFTHSMHIFKYFHTFF